MECDSIREFNTKYSMSEDKASEQCIEKLNLFDTHLGQKEGGQALLGGLDCLVHRNFFGAQINSFETNLPAPAELRNSGGDSADKGSETYPAFFIRAPGILETGPGVEVLSGVESKRESRLV